ncbi:MAG TPA: flavin reductase family protein [Terriglobia bacterium]|nr:flavin reductase family protein [Terriglobia bacterium]
MHYDPRHDGHGLPHNPFYSLVVPRPIGWITSISETGVVNLAPYSFFNAVSSDPPVVMYSSDGRKDTLNNIEKTGEFVCNLATWDLRDAMNATSGRYPPDVSEPEVAGLEMVPSVLVAPPRVKASPAALECRYLQSIELTNGDGVPIGNTVVLGEVVQIHIADEVITDGRVDLTKIRPIARLGYMDYTVVDTIFSMKRPG